MNIEFGKVERQPGRVSAYTMAVWLDGEYMGNAVKFGERGHWESPPNAGEVHGHRRADDFKRALRRAVAERG